MCVIHIYVYVLCIQKYAYNKHNALYYYYIIYYMIFIQYIMKYHSAVKLRKWTYVQVTFQKITNIILREKKQISKANQKKIIACIIWGLYIHMWLTYEFTHQHNNNKIWGIISRIEENRNAYQDGYMGISTVFERFYMLNGIVVILFFIPICHNLNKENEGIIKEIVGKCK